ncbi:MAG TPA: DEAD/DEAH box helicase [Actinomycetaceae bacterium]|nr:DEAD/DEAH box helicase [Actinomycetaceae bacterium]
MTDFQSFLLPDPLARAAGDLGFHVPTDIQRSAIPALLDGRDVVGIAQTGTGKTAAFGLPLLSHVDPDKAFVQALVLTPTRELAIQVADHISSYARHIPTEIVPVYGGSSYVPQLRALKHGAQVVVGTPGRVMDLMERGALDLSGVRVFVLDEADEMLTMGFAEDVDKIAESVPRERVTALFSATMPPAIERVAKAHLTEPLRIEVTPAASTVENIEQTYAVVPFRFKEEALIRVLATWREDAAIVFVRTRSTAEEVGAALASAGVRAATISGDVPQSERERIVERLRRGSLDVLVATDVAARGLDVERVGLVINFDVPREPEAYVHRIGRTGRAGRSGRALTFFTPKEFDRLRRIERTTGSEITEVKVPTPDDVADHRIGLALRGLPSGDLDRYLRAVEESGMDPLHVAAALLAKVTDLPPTGPTTSGRLRREESVDEDGSFLHAHFDGQGRGSDARPRSARSSRPRRDGEPDSRQYRAEGKGSRGGRQSRGEGTYRHRYRVEVGHRDGVRPGAIVGALTGDGRIDGSDIGRIDILPSFSLVDLAIEPSDDQMRRLQKTRVAGRALRMAPDQGPGSGRVRHERRASSRESRNRR